MTPQPADLHYELLDIKSETLRLGANLESILSRIANWEAQWQNRETHVSLPPVLAEEKPLASAVPSPILPEEQPIPAPLQSAEVLPLPVSSVPASVSVRPRVPRKKIQVKLPPQLVAALAYPFEQVFSYSKGIYQNYQAENKLPVFFMTLGGIMALLFGFGYLMQLGVSYLLDHISERTFEILKTAGSFLMAGGILFWGERLIRKGKQYQEFGSAILGLGISLIYLILYFLGDMAQFPLFQQAWIGWGLVLLNSALGVWLGLRHEAKVVAVISLLGGAFTPFYLHATQVSDFYLGYLWLLSATAVWLSQKIDWPPLRVGAFLVVSFLGEWIWFQHPEQLSLLSVTIAVHAFTYLFAGIGLHNGTQWKRELTGNNLLLVVGSVGLFIVNLFLLYQSQKELPLLGAILLGNALLVGAGLFTQYQQLSASLRWLGFLLLGGLIGLAIPAILNQAWMGLAWAFEGWLLLVLGLKLDRKKVRLEALVILGIAAGKMLLSFPLVFSHWSLSLWSAGYFNWLSLGLSFIGLLWAYHQFPQKSKWEQQVQKAVKIGLGVWFSGAWLLTSVWYLGNWGWLLALVPVGLLVGSGFKLRLRDLEILGLGQLLLLTVPYFLSVVATGSFRFSLQSLPAQSGLIFLGAAAFSLQFWYDRFWEESPFHTHIRGLREIVYVLLPHLFLRPVYRHYPELAPFALALSGTLSLLLAAWLHKKKPLFAPLVLNVLAHVALIALLGHAWSAWGVLISSGTPLREITFYYQIAGILALIGMSQYWKHRLPLAQRIGWEISYIWIAWLGAFLLVGWLEDASPILISLFFLGLSLLSDRQRLGVGTVLQVLSTFVWLGAWIDWLGQYPTYLVWGSMLISVSVYYGTRKKALRIWTLMLAILNILLLLGNPTVLSGIVGLFALSGIYVAERRFVFPTSRTRMLMLQRIALLYPGLLLGLMMVKIGDATAISSALAIGGIYYLVLSRMRSLTPSLLPIYLGVYRVGQILLGLAILSLFRTSMSTTFDFVLPMSGLAYLFLQNRSWSQYYPDKSAMKWWEVDQWLSHFSLLGYYIGFHGYLGGNYWGIGLTPFLIVHGLGILFLSAKEKYAFLLRFSIALFVVGFAKLVLYDFSHFGLLPKVLVSMGVGALMLIGSRLFLRYRQGTE